MKKACALLCAMFPALVHAAYVPDPTEAAVLEAVMRDEAPAFMRGDPSLIGASPEVAAAKANAPGEAAAIAAKAVATLRKDIADFYLGKPTRIQVSTLAINVSMYAHLLPAGHGCPDHMEKCRQALTATERSGKRDEALASVLKRFQDAGLDLSPFEALRKTADHNP
ncbi:hypothetical protein [Achromobacter arsenitoxydans]|nr:hypothetical protein [Achromobacter arsenitoxydans]